MSLQATLGAMDASSVPLSPPAPMQITPEPRPRPVPNLDVPVPSSHRGDQLVMPNSTPQGVPVYPRYSSGILPRPTTSSAYGPTSSRSATQLTDWNNYGLQARPSTSTAMTAYDLPIPGMTTQGSFAPGGFSPSKELLQQQLLLQKEQFELTRQQDHANFQQMQDERNQQFKAIAENLTQGFRQKAEQHVELAKDRQDVAVATIEAKASSAIHSEQQQLQRLQQLATEKLQQSSTQLQSVQLQAQHEIQQQSQVYAKRVCDLEAYADRTHSSEISACKNDTDNVKREANDYITGLQEANNQKILNAEQEIRALQESLEYQKQALTNEAREHIDYLQANHSQVDHSLRSQTEMMRHQFILENSQLRLDLEAAHQRMQLQNDGSEQVASTVTQLQQTLQAAESILQEKNAKVLQMEREAAEQQATIHAHQARTAQDATERVLMKQNLEGLQKQVQTFQTQRQATGSAANRAVSIDGGSQIFEIGTPRERDEPSPDDAHHETSPQEDWSTYVDENGVTWTAQQWNEGQWDHPPPLMNDADDDNCPICMPQGIPTCVCADRQPPTVGQWFAKQTPTGLQPTALSSALRNFNIPSLNLDGIQSGIQQMVQALPDISHQAKPEQSLPVLPFLRTDPSAQAFQHDPNLPQGSQSTHPKPPSRSLSQPPNAQAAYNAGAHHNHYEQRHYKEAEHVGLLQIPETAGTDNWNAANRRQIMSASGRPLEAFNWFNEILAAKSIEDLEDGIEWQTLTYKTAAELHKKIGARPELQRTIRATDARLTKQGKPPLNGRQIYWMILQDLRVGPYDTSLKRQWDLIHIRMRGGQLHKFQQEFKDCLYAIPESEFPHPQFIEDIYSNQVKLHYGFYQIYQLYLLETEQQGLPKSYERLSGMVDKWLAARHQEYNTNQYRQHQAWAPGGPQGLAYPAAQGKPKGPPAGECPQGYYQGQCSRPNCPLTHNLKGKGKGKGKSQSRGRTPRQPSKGAGKGKGKKGKGKGKSGKSQPSTPRTPRTSSRGTSPSGNANAQPCRDWVTKGYCPREAAQKNSCPYWHQQQCYFYSTKGQWCQLGHNCQFLHAHIYEQQNYSQRPPSKDPFKGSKKGKDDKGKGKGKWGKGKDDKGKGKGKDDKGKGKGKGKDKDKNKPTGAPATPKPKAKAKGKNGGPKAHVAVHADNASWDTSGETWSADQWSAGKWHSEQVEPLNQQGSEQA